ncbi:TlpA family protein disulfide reductase [Algibacter miyuki]|uniref:TlpA family protein disulfide reductase n=1 Tax=Algibacter miyuki TaxID=1306933 RepID=A0ABV5GXW1_9FLAO|nr:TlpA disulfide reductase family protein [Algibacter miyuki]MDN3667443.1 TlpA disulfide reductase family protein [Algibacter miyuki]
MKKGLYALLALFIMACNSNSDKDFAIITGKITNNNASKLSLVKGNDAANKFTINVSADGVFRDTLRTDSELYTLYTGPQQALLLHVTPGDSLHISLDKKDYLNTVAISGKGASASIYLLEKTKIFSNAIGSPQETFSLNQSEYKSKLVSIKKQQEELLTNSKNLPVGFAEKDKRNITYEYFNWLLRYEKAHVYFTKNKAFEVDDTFLVEMADFDYNNEEDFKFSNSYKNILMTHFSDISNELSKKDNIAKDIAAIKTAASIKNQTIKNSVLFDFANAYMDTSSDIEALYNLFLDHSTNEHNNDVIIQKYNNLTGLKAGKPSPKFINYRNFAGGTTSLDDLKGKYVYIDVWATWCGPCIREIPSLKKLEKQYHGKNIEFVSISIDQESDFKTWKEMVAGKNLTGIQLFSDNSGGSQFVIDYKIESIPRFILIDPKGDIVQTDAPRPSSSQVITLFNSLNI